MAVFFNAPKDGSKFSSAWIKDWENINSNIEFDALRFTSDDDYYYVYMFAKKFTDLLNLSDKNWKFEPQLMAMQIQRKDVEKWSSKESKKIPSVQSLPEKLVCRFLDKCDASKTYKGFLALQNNGFVNTALTGIDPSGKPVPEALIEQIFSGFGNLEEAESDLIADDDVKAPVKKSWSGGSKGQSELEKLNDRLSFISAQIKASGYNYEVKCALDICEFVVAERMKDGYDCATIMSVIEACKSLM